MNITYCFNGGIALYDKNQETYYDHESIIPSNVIGYSPVDCTKQTVKQIYFDLGGSADTFALALISRSMDCCFTLFRVLVYRQTCPDQDECKGTRSTVACMWFSYYISVLYHGKV